MLNIPPKYLEYQIIFLIFATIEDILSSQSKQGLF